MKYILVLLTMPFLFGFCDIYSTCQVPSYLDMPKAQPPQVLGYGANSPSNPYSMNPPSIYAPDGTYLGRLSANPNLPDSTSNPNGLYGSTWGTNSINNPNGLYGGKRKGY